MLVRRNTGTKISILVCVTFAMFCSIYSATSCQWQVFTPSDSSTRDWSFLPADTSIVYSIGLFGYQLKMEGARQWDVPCTQYPSLFVSESFLFLFPQIFTILSAVSSLVALSLLLSEHKRGIAGLILLAGALQALGFVLSLHWSEGGSVWQSSFLAGFASNAGAVCFHTVAFVIARWILKRTQPKSENDEHEKEESSMDSDSYGTPSVPEMSFNDKDLESSTAEETDDPAKTAEELLGMDDPIATRAVGHNVLVIQQMKSFLRRQQPTSDECEENYLADDEV